VKILLLSDCLDNGGLERQMALLATSLPAGHDARVWTLADGPFGPHLRERGVPVKVSPRRLRLDPFAPLGLLPVLRAWRPDVVHSWSWIAALAAVPLCRALGIPLVNGLIQSGAIDKEHVALKRLSLSGARLVVANSRAGLRAWDIPARKGRVVYNGFDRSRLPAAAEVAPRMKGRFTVVMAARMTPVKLFEVVIEAARRLADESPDWRFLLVGDGPDRPRLKQSARDLTERGVVEFPDPGIEVLDVVASADCGVLMTNPRLAFEGISNSIMEYMALGLPVVCGDGGGNPELVQDGVTGFIVPPADATSLTSRLRYLRDHPGVGKEMGAAGSARILSEFSVRTMVGNMMKVYAEATEHA
jgi:glycosyltransferase involved in cell wall biosynthesis